MRRPEAGSSVVLTQLGADEPRRLSGLPRPSPEQTRDRIGKGAVVKRSGLTLCRLASRWRGSRIVWAAYRDRAPTWRRHGTASFRPVATAGTRGSTKHVGEGLKLCQAIH